MKSIRKIRKLSLRLVVTLIIAFLSISLIAETLILPSANNTNESIHVDEKENLRSSAVTSKSYTNVEWLNNINFSTGISPWTNTTGGDPTDINGTYSSGVANYEVLGDSGKFELIVDPSNATEMAKWRTTKIDNVIYPQIKGKTSEGFYASHFWDESGGGGQDNFSCSVRWIRQVKLPVDMSDYTITSASFKAQFNATVEAESFNEAGGGNDDDYGGLEVPGDTTWPGQDDTWDYAYFSAEISSQDNPQMKTLLAYNKTSHLGEDVGPPNDNVSATIPDTDMTSNLDEDLLAKSLESALSVDNYNFTIYLGIDLFCADNWGNVDRDNFTSLLIRSLNLTFTYEKWIDYGSQLSWRQSGYMINHTSEQYYSSTNIDEVKMNFDYKVNESWTSKSPNSEIRILIHDNEQKIYPKIKLSDYNYTEHQGDFIRARTENYDFTSLIHTEENISLSIQVFMADPFELDHRINISIDNIHFLVSYTVFYNPPSPAVAVPDDDDNGKTTVVQEPWVNLLIAIAAIVGGGCLGAYLLAYQLYLKYPPAVRKVRKYRKTLKKKAPPKTEIDSREASFKNIYMNKLGDFANISKVKAKGLTTSPEPTLKKKKV